MALRAAPLRGTTGPTGAAGPTGATGASGTGFTWRGAWSSVTAYAVGDVVTNGGNSFIAVLSNTNVTPTDISAQWDAIVIVGPAGPQGITGATGAAGATGATGATGAAGAAGGTTVPLVNKTANFQVATADVGKRYQASSAGAITVTVPLNATDAIPVESVYEIIRRGTGGVSVAAAVGVTINSPYGYLTLARQFSVVALVKVGTNEWDLTGDLV